MKFILTRVGDDLIFFEREHISDIMILKSEIKQKLQQSRIQDTEKEQELPEEFSVAVGIDGRQSYKIFTGSLSDCISFVNTNFGQLKSSVMNFEKFLKDNS